MNIKRKLLTFVFLLSVAIHSIKAIEDISVKNATEKDVVLSDAKIAVFRVKDLNYDGNNTYLIINTESKDQGKTFGELYLNTIEEPEGRTKAQLMSVEKGDNLLFLNKDFIGSKTQFYLEVHCNDKCNVKLKFSYASTVQIPFGKDYQYISPPRKDIAENHFKMEVKQEDFPAVVYIVSPNDFAVFSSSVIVSCKGKIEVIFDEFDGGLIAVLNQTEITEGEGTRTLDFTVFSVPNALVTIGVRKQDSSSMKLNVGHKMIYSFIETSSYKECFEFDGASNNTYSMSVLPFKKNLRISDKEKGEDLEKDLDYHKTIIFKFGPTETKKTFCFQVSEGNKETIYGFQIEEYSTMTPEKNALKEPLYHGLIYSLESKNGDAIYYRHYRREYIVDALTNMNVNLVKGKIEVYKIKCETFPDCPTRDDKLKNPVHEVNGFYTVQSDIYMEPSLLSATQNLIVVKCLTAECGYEVSFFSDSDVMELKQENRYNQFMKKSETGDYKIRNEDKDANKIIVRLIPISGDLYIKMVDNPFVEMKYIYIGTDTIVEITENKEYEPIKPLVDSFFFVVQATGEGYYSVSYEVIKESSSKDKRRVPTGIYSMETMPAKNGEKATFVVKNRKIAEKQPFLTSFFPINCDVTIKRTGGKDIVEEDGIFQDILYETESDYNKTEYSYDVTLTNMEEKATFTDERCIIYVAAIEKGSPVVLGEGHFIQMSLDKRFPEITYLIPFTNLGKNLLANYVIENEIPLRISLTAEGQSIGASYVTKRNMPFLINADTYSTICSRGICNLEFTTKIHKQSEIPNEKRVRFDFIVRTQNNVPSYLKKRLLREEVVFSDDPYFFITDVGLNEEGEIILNYNKGSGVLAARIVPKNTTDAFPTWGGRYEFPDPYSGESLKFNPYTQSISYGMNQTQYCENGCDLLISVYTMETFRSEDKINTDYFEDFSIFVKSTQKDDELGGIVDIPLNEFIQGHLEKLSSGSNKKDAYTLTVNNDCKELYLEIQGELVDIYINFDKKKLPTQEESDFQCTSTGENQICKITKFDNFKGHTLSFIVASQTKESVVEFNVYYLFKFRALTLGWEKYNIYELNSDHGVKCNVDQGEYCYFLFPLRNYQIYNVLYFFAEGEILSDFTIYANLVNADNYESSLSLSDIESYIPSESKSKKSTAGSFWKNLLIMDEQYPEDFILLSIKSERKTTITFMNTYKENIKSTYPKPKASQIYKVETEGEDSSLILKLPSDTNYEMYMQSIVGSMLVLSRDEDKKSFLIKGNGDSILVSFNENDKPDFETSMEIFALEDDSLFFVEYRPKNIKDNFQQIKFGSTTEISFDDVGFPVAFYAKIPDNMQEKDYVANFRYKGEHTQFTEKEIDDFKVEAAIVDFKFIQRRLKDKTKIPETTKGIYNSFLRSGYVSILNDDSINSAQYVYLQMNNSESNPKISYQDIHLEVSVLPLSEKKSLAPDSQYNHAFLLDNQKECNLHTIKRRFEEENIMIFEFSTISPNVGFALLKYNDSIKDENARESDEDIMNHLKYKIETGGKITWIFKFQEESGNKFPERIILSVFNNSTEKLAKKDSAYVYRFITSISEMNPNQLKEDDMKYTYYKNKEFVISSSQPTIFLPDSDEVIVSPSDYYILLLPKGSKYNTQSIAIREIERYSTIFYDTEDSKKYLRIKFSEFPAVDSDAIAMFAMSDNSVDLFAYKVAHEVTKDPQDSSDIIQLKFENSTIEYETQDNDDKYIFFFNISIPDIKSKRPFFDVRVKSKDNVTENDLFFSSTEKYPTRDSAELISDERLNDALFISATMMENTKTMHLSVVCEELCDFKLTISNADNIVIFPGEHVRHLFRGEKNIELPVHITERPAGSNDKKYLTIFTFGGDGIHYPNLFYSPSKNDTDEGDKSKISNEKEVKMKKFFNGYVVTVDTSTYPLENEAVFKLTVFSNSGLISVGSRFMNDDEYNKYRVFDNEVRGLLLSESNKECFPIEGTPSKNNEIESTIFTTTKVKVYFEKLESTEKIEGTEHIIEYQDSIVFGYEEEAKICFEKVDEDAEGTSFAFQIIQNSDFDTKDSYKIASKVNGLIYRQNVDNRKIIYYRHSKYKELPLNGNDQPNMINFNLKIIEGAPKFYIHHCEMFPNCEYNNETIPKYFEDGSLIKPTKVGDFYIGTIDTSKEKHELSGDQYLVIVDCYDSPIECKFEISFYDERDTLKLRPSDSFNQFMTDEDNDKFSFTILDPNVKQIDVKLHILSGNAYIENTEQPKNVKSPATIDVGCNQIKRFSDEGGKMTGEYSFNVKAIESSYYMITVSPIVDKTKNEQTLPRGTVVLETFPDDKEKIIAFDHFFRNGDLALWSIKIYSINCDLSISVLNEKNEEAYKFGCMDGFCHDEISPNRHEDIFVQQKIKYKLISEKRYGDDGDNTCKFYVATQERTQDDQLVYGMNSPFKLFFDKNFPDTKIIYPFANTYNNAIMNLVLEDESHLNITIKVNGNKFDSYSTMKGRAIASKGFNKICNSKEDACVLEYSMRALEEQEIIEGFVVDFSIKSSTLIPSYLQRRKIREEFSFSDDIQYYVADVGNNEEGTVQVHFNRGKGMIFAKIVRKDVIESGEKKYRGRVVLPKPDDAKLKMDQFTMQIKYNTAEYNCTGSNQCEIYIGVIDNQEYYSKDANKYLNDFSIYIKANKRNDTNKNSVVDIPLNEYISGSLYKTRLQDKKDAYDYYVFNVPINTTEFTIEFYTEAVDMYIKNTTDEEPPEDSNYTYKLETDGGPGILTIKSENGKESLKNREYYIAIGTDKIDQIIAARYMIRIVATEKGLPFNQELNSDDSILSRVFDEDEKKENKYAHFILPARDYDRPNNEMDMYLYAYSRTTTDLQIFVKFITEDEYASLTPETLDEAWPTESIYEISSINQFNTDYLHIDPIFFSRNWLMLISIKAPKKEFFYLTATNRLQIKKANLVPFSSQVFDIDWKYTLDLTYPDDHDYLLHITCINGAGTVHFGEKIYNLKGIHDTLIITINKGDAKGKIIHIESADDEVGFDIMTQYNIRPELENFDEIRYGENGEIVIMDDDLPLIFYTKVYKPENLAFNFKFNDIDIKGKDKQKAYDLTVNGGVVDYSKIIEKRNNPKYSFENPHTHSGKFDKSGMAMLFMLESECKSDIEEYNITNPYFYISISKSQENTEVFSYIHGEFSFLPSTNIDIPAPLNQYTSSYLHVEASYAMFRLRKEEMFHSKLIIQFSSPNTNVKIAFQDQKPAQPFYTNTSEIVEKEPKGKKDLVILNFKENSDSIYLCVYTDKQVNDEKEAAPFTFRYYSGNSGDTWELPTNGYEIDRYKGEDRLFVKIPQVKKMDKQFYKATYYFKLIEADSVGKNIDISSIAISFITYTFTQTITTTKEDESKEFINKEFKFKLDNKKDYYAAVTAYFPELDEMASYGLKKFKGEGKEDDKKKEGSKWWIILIIIGVAIVLLASGILLSKYLQAKKDTETNMMKTSFIGSNLVPGEDEEKNILK